MRPFRHAMTTKQTFENFDDLVAQAQVPLLVDFYADWCGPCRMIAKVLEQVKQQLKSQVQIVKIDTERYPEIASQFQIYALPTLILFHRGQQVERIEGVQPPEALIAKVQALK